MRTLPLLLASVATLAFAASPDNSRPARAKVVNVEKLINTQIASMYPEEPYFLLGTARGMYLEGFGVVFSAEVNLATGPSLSPFKPSVTKEEIARHREKKEARLPALRTKMVTVVANMSSLLETLPKTEEYVLAVTLLRYPWEENAGQPSQIVMRVQHSKLIEAQRANAKPESVIQVQEY